MCECVGVVTWIPEGLESQELVVSPQTWVLDTKLMSSGRATSARNCWTFFTATEIQLFKGRKEVLPHLFPLVVPLPSSSLVLFLFPSILTPLLSLPTSSSFDAIDGRNERKRWVMHVHGLTQKDHKLTALSLVRTAVLLLRANAENTSVVTKKSSVWDNKNRQQLNIKNGPHFWGQKSKLFP